MNCADFEKNIMGCLYWFVCYHYIGTSYGTNNFTCLPKHEEARVEMQLTVYVTTVEGDSEDEGFVGPFYPLMSISPWTMRGGLIPAVGP